MLFLWQSIDRYAFIRKVHTWKMLSVSLTFESITLKMSSCHVDLVISNCDKVTDKVLLI